MLILFMTLPSYIEVFILSVKPALTHLTLLSSKHNPSINKLLIGLAVEKEQKKINLLKLVINRIQKKTKVPVLLPAMFEGGLNEYYKNSDNKNEFYGDAVISPKSYTVCIPIKICFYGETISNETLDGYQQFQQTVINSPKTYMCKTKPNPSEKNESGFITLSKGIKAFYNEPTRVVYCGYPVITWRQGNYQYSVSQKFGGLKGLVKLANSAIDNQP